MPLPPVKPPALAPRRPRPPGRLGPGTPGAGRSDTPGLPARRAAAFAVAAVLADGRVLEDALADHALPPGDGALARAVAVTTFRRFGTIRAALAARLRKGLPADPHLMAVLATGAAQVLFLEVADHAAVDLAVRLVGESPRTRHLTGLVNAVLRGLARDREAVLADDDPVCDLPDGLRERWRRLYGPHRTAALAAAHRAGAALDLTCRGDAAGWAERLGGAVLPTGSVRLDAAERRPVSDLPGYEEGGWWVQDAAAALPVRLLPTPESARVLDLCAAPGGKTAQLAAQGWRVIALDRSSARLERLRANLGRLRLPAEIVCADVLEFAAEPFDAVLLDAPCTATGTVRRHPDIAWTKGPDDLSRLVEIQARLLDRAAELTRPGGGLVYCVCSLEPEEGETQAEAFLRRRPDFQRAPVDTGALGLDDRFRTEAGDLRTAPDLWAAGAGTSSGTRPGLDGFFAASFRRRA